MLRRTFIVFLLLVLGCSSPLAQQSRGKGKGPKPPPEPVEMGILFFDGGEHQSSGTPDSNPIGNGRVVDTTNQRTGSACVDLGSANLDSLAFTIYNGQEAVYYNVPTTYLSFYLLRKGNCSSGNNLCWIMHTNGAIANDKLHLQWGSSHVLEVVTATGTTTGTTTINTDTWYRIDIECGTGASAFWEVKIDGTSEISGTEDLNTNNMSSVGFYEYTNNNDCRVDDIVVRDDQTHPGDDLRVESLFPDGDGNYTSWSGNGYLDVDEKVADGTEVTSSTNGDRETYTLENLSALGGDDTIDATMIVCTVDKGTTNPDVAVELIERESSTDRDSAPILLVKDDQGGRQLFLTRETKPSSGAWTESAVNGLEVGVQHAQVQARTVYMDRIAVNVLISTTASGGGSANAGRMTLLGVQ